MLTLWWRAFLCTQIVELLVAVPLLTKDAQLNRRVGAVLLANLASHPIAFFVVNELFVSAATSFLVAEAWAVLSEVVLYRFVLSTQLGRAAGVSLLANGASLAVGTVLLHVGWLG